MYYNYHDMVPAGRPKQDFVSMPKAQHNYGFRGRLGDEEVKTTSFTTKGILAGRTISNEIQGWSKYSLADQGLIIYAGIMESYTNFIPNWEALGRLIVNNWIEA